MRRTKSLLSNLVLLVCATSQRSAGSLAARGLETSPLVKPRFDVGGSAKFLLSSAFGFYSDTQIRTLQLEITSEWFMLLEFGTNSNAQANFETKFVQYP